MSNVSIFNPPGTGKVLGQYSQVARVKASEFLFISGQLSTDGEGHIVGEGEFTLQVKQVFDNVHRALVACGADWSNVCSLVYYLVHSQDVQALMNWRAENFPSMFRGDAYPPATLLIVDRLVKEPFLFEITATAAL